MKKSYIVGGCLTLLIIFSIILCIPQNKPSQAKLFDNSSYINDILILYTNDKNSALTLTTNSNTISPIIYFDTIYTSIVEADSVYYLTNEIDFLRINADGTLEVSDPLTSYSTVIPNIPDYPTPVTGFVYKQKNDTYVIIQDGNFPLNDYKLTNIIQVNDYFQS